ncbi:glutaredoxin-2-like protein, partial [Leptotrombidium deliense]
AKQIIDGYNVKSNNNNYEVIELEKRPDCSQIQSYLKTLTGASTVPRIFVCGKSVGGCDDLVKLHESGQFREMLSECGVV